MTTHTRRSVLGGCGTTAVALLSGCLLDGQEGESEPTDAAGTPTGTDEESPSPSSDQSGSTSGGVHGDPYPVTIWVTARPIDAGAVDATDVTTFADADLTDRERALLVDVVERGETDHWSGQSDEAPPERLRTLVTLSDRLPPSPHERDPEDAWRYARGTKAYVEFEGTVYEIEMVKVAP